MTVRTSGLTDPLPALRGPVLAWGLPRLRDLPWRATRDPWEVLVSEVMLQQTGAQRVVPKWLEFLAAMPTARDCAAAPLGDVLRLWQGLGYPRRARNLHAAAGHVVERHGGRVPDDLDALLALPGVGPYTARAVLAFAFERDVAVVDTNIARVYARVLGRRLTAREVQTVADATAVTGEAWAWNQTLMELGATLCRPASPGCGECPIRSDCAWGSDGRVSPDPASGSAGVSTRQAPFEGSDRQARGRLMKALAERPVARSDLSRVMGVVDARATRLAAGLVAEGLAVDDGSRLRLP